MKKIFQEKTMKWDIPHTLQGPRSGLLFDSGYLQNAE